MHGGRDRHTHTPITDARRPWSSYPHPHNWCTETVIVIPTAPELMHGGRDRHTHSPRTYARRPWLIMALARVSMLNKAAHRRPSFQRLEGASGFFTMQTYTHKKGQSIASMNIEWISEFHQVKLQSATATKLHRSRCVWHRALWHSSSGPSQ